MEYCALVLQPIISHMVDHLIPKIEGFFGKNEAREIAKWKIIIRDFNAVLQDADERKGGNQALNEWVRDLVNLIGEVEDTIEVMNYEVLKREVESSSSKMPNFAFLSGIFGKRRKFSRHLSAMTKRLQDLNHSKSVFNLVSNPVREHAVVKRPPSSSHIANERFVYGRGDEKREIMNLLLQETENAVEVIAIVGMGGLGKTTLARYAFNEVSSFDKKVWVCVSQDYDITRVTVQILLAVCPECKVEGQALSWIQEKLSHTLRDQKFLIVLDDLWNHNYEEWGALRPPFASGSVGSRIIVTTRDHRVADIVKTIKATVSPKALSDEDCLSLLCEHAGLDRTVPSYKVKVAKEIAKKCAGLPLAATTVGGLLRNTKEERWETIRNSEPWRVSKGGVDVMSILKLSYNDLNPYLKKCFSFFSMLPEDYKFQDVEIQLRWIGAGLIQVGVNEGKTKQQVAEEYFDELLSRSLIMFFGTCDFTEMKCYIIHDMLRDVAKEAFWGHPYIGLNGKIPGTFEGTRHISCHLVKVKDVLNVALKVTDGYSHLRTFNTHSDGILFLPVSESESNEAWESDKAFSRLKHLRQLTLFGMGVIKCPRSFHKLKLLKYLHLSFGLFEFLPDSLTSLYYLEILILQSCYLLKTLPRKLGNLVNLHHLDVDSCNKFTQLPTEIGKLRNLCNLCISAANMSSVPVEIGNLENLRAFRLSSLENLEDLPMEIGKLQNLRCLNIAALSSLKELPADVVKLENLQYLNVSFCKRLKNLPTGIEKLQNLRCVDVRLSGIETIPNQIKTVL